MKNMNLSFVLKNGNLVGFRKNNPHLKVSVNFSIVFRFVVQLLYMLPSLHGILRQQCLEALASCIESYEEPRSIFTELKGNALDACLNHRCENQLFL